MAGLNWTDFNGDRFQRLCNMLLLHEVSRHVEVYAAKGPDKGIDARYEGNYDGENGKWRFQAKFKTVDKKTALRKLREDLKKDIKNNVEEEDFLVFLFNQEIRPEEKESLSSLVEEELTKNGKTLQGFLLWEGAKIEGLLGNHGVVYQYFFEPDGTELQPWQEAFARSLNPDQAGPINDTGPFLGREKELKDLMEWSESSNQQFCTVSGPGGWGKSRLLLEFFKQLDENKSEWSIWVPVSRTSLDVPKLEKALRGTDKVILLLDDADRIPNVSEFLDRMVTEAYKDRVKVILAVREVLRDQFFSALPYQSLNSQIISLDRLDDATTDRMFAHLLKGVYPLEDSFRMAKASGGVPLFILAMASAANRGLVSVFSEKGGFDMARIVKDHIRQIVAKAEKDRLGDEDLFWRTICLMALLSPFTLDKQGKVFCDGLGIKAGKLRKVVQFLEEVGLLQIVGERQAVFLNEDSVDLLIKDKERRIEQEEDWYDLRTGEKGRGKFIYYPLYEYAIKPDPYADYLVADHFDDLESLAEIFRNGFSRKDFLTAIENLWRSRHIDSEMGQLAASAFHWLDESLKKKYPVEKEYWEQVFSVLKSLRYEIGEINTRCLFAVKDWVLTPHEPEEEASPHQFFSPPPAKHYHNFRGKIKELTNHILSSLEIAESDLDAIEELSEVLGVDLRISGAFKLTREDVYGSQPFSRQSVFARWIRTGPWERTLKYAKEFLGITWVPWEMGKEFEEEKYRAKIKRLEKAKIELVEWLAGKLDHLHDQGERNDVLRILYKSAKEIRTFFGDPFIDDNHNLRVPFPDYGIRIFSLVSEHARKKENLGDRYFLAGQGILNLIREEELRDRFLKLQSHLEEVASLSEKLLIAYHIDSNRNSQSSPADLIAQIDSISKLVEILTDLGAWDKARLGKMYNWSVGSVAHNTAKSGYFNRKEVFQLLWDRDSELAMEEGYEYLSFIFHEEDRSDPFFWEQAEKLLNSSSGAGILGLINVFDERRLRGKEWSHTPAEISFYHRIGVQLQTISIPEFDYALLDRTFCPYPIQYRAHQKYSKFLGYLWKQDSDEFDDDVRAFLNTASSKHAYLLLSVMKEELVSRRPDFLEELLMTNCLRLDIFEASEFWEKAFQKLYQEKGAGVILSIMGKRIAINQLEDNPIPHFGAIAFPNKLNIAITPYWSQTAEQAWDEFLQAFRWFVELDAEKLELRLKEAFLMLRFWLPKHDPPEHLATYLMNKLTEFAKSTRQRWMLWLASIAFRWKGELLDEKGPVLTFVERLRETVENSSDHHLDDEMAANLNEEYNNREFFLDWNRLWVLFHLNPVYEGEWYQDFMDQMCNELGFLSGSDYT